MAFSGLVSMFPCYSYTLNQRGCLKPAGATAEGAGEVMSNNTAAIFTPVAGGVHNGEYVSWLYCYDPVMDVWARKQDMNTKRAIHTLAGMNDRLYAIGGNHLKGKEGFSRFHSPEVAQQIQSLVHSGVSTAAGGTWVWVVFVASWLTPSHLV